MTAQPESIDISQIRRFALELESCDGRQLDLASSTPRPASTTSNKAPSSCSGNNNRQPAPTLGPSHITRRQDGVKIPSTVPESVKQKMQQSTSQSPRTTQPASQWVYDQLTNLKDTSQEGSGLNGTNGTPQDEAWGSHGVGGHINNNGATELMRLDGQDEEEDDLSQDVRAEPFPESKRFHVPKTPASQGRKRKRDSPSITQDIETPSLPVNPFANRNAGQTFMGPSQLFNVTQAQTSPPLVSDGLSDRPSPDLHNLKRPSTAGTMNSPVPLPRPDMVRAVTEPHTTYVSMKESQEARERRQRMLEQDLSPDELSDEDFAQMDSVIRRKLERKHIDEITRRQLAGITNRTQPALSNSVQQRRGGRTIEKTHSSPLRSGRRINEVVLISDDLPDLPTDDLRGSITEEETEIEEDVGDSIIDAGDDISEGNKENIEVPMTGTRDQMAALPGMTPSSPSVHPIRRSARVTRASESGTRSSGASLRQSSDKALYSSRSSQAYAVADSQSSQSAKHITKTPKSIRVQQRPSSSDNSRAMVPQSQTSQEAKKSLSPSISDERARRFEVQGMRVRPLRSSANVERSSAKSTHDQAVGGHTHNTSSSVRVPIPNTSNRTTSNHDSTYKQVEIGTSSSSRQPALTDLQDSITVSTDHVRKSIPSPRSTPKSATNSARKESTLSPSGPSTLYETAREQAPDTPSISRIRNLQRRERSNDPSPGKSPSQRFRTIEEIVGQSSVPDHCGTDELNIDLLGKDDHQFLKATSDTSSKQSTPRNRRLMTRQPPQSRTQPRPAVQIENEVSGTPNSPSASAISFLTPPNGCSQEEVAKKPMAEPDKVDRGLSTEKIPSTILSQSVSSQALQAVSAQVSPPVDKVAKYPSHQSEAQVQQPHPTTIIAPNRVFAHFNGHKSTFSAATCTGIIPGPDPQFKVTFDDTNISTVGGYGIKRLELRVGDICKVDLEGHRAKTYVVHGTGTLITPDEQALPVSTDIFGHTTVDLKAKGRDSMGGDAAESTDEKITVPIRQIYFTQTNWTHVKERDFNFPAPAMSNLQSPSERPSTPSTPSSRVRQNRATALQPARSATIPTSPNEALFHNVVFTLTNISVASDLQQTSTLIKIHGGRILDSGFDELFQVPNLSRTTSPSKNRSNTFNLKSSAELIGFTCLIADGHCRRAKYIQALALGIPCLATRWIHDCVSKNELLELPPYLLPAGESSYLKGAVRSRVLCPIPNPVVVTLRSIFDARPKMLDGAAVLVIMHKQEESKMKHHNFLTHALGAGRVAKATSIEAAAKTLKDTNAGWDYVFSYDREKETEEAVFGGSRKRKRISREEGPDSGTKLKVVGNEYVVQSLILGQLLDS